MSRRDPWSDDQTSMTSPTFPSLMAPMSAMRGPGQNDPRASTTRAVAALEIASANAFAPSNEHRHFALARLGHEFPHADDVVDDRVEVLLLEVQEVGRHRARVDLHIPELLGLL